MANEDKKAKERVMTHEVYDEYCRRCGSDQIDTALIEEARAEKERREKLVALGRAKVALWEQQHGARVPYPGFSEDSDWQAYWLHRLTYVNTHPNGPERETAKTMRRVKRIRHAAYLNDTRSVSLSDKTAQQEAENKAAPLDHATWFWKDGNRRMPKHNPGQ